MKCLTRIAAALLAAHCLFAHADETEPMGGIGNADAREIQEAVQTQLDALAVDDAAAAFEMATPAKRMLIGSPAHFMDIIREQYPAIYRYLGAIFSQPEVLDGIVVQTVWVTSGDRHVWLAIFGMERDENGRWKIDGCELLETTTVAI